MSNNILLINNNKSESQSEQNETSLLEQLNPSEYVLYSRINNHLLFHFVPLAEFWQSHRLCVTIKDFQTFLQRMKFSKGREQLQQMKEQGIEFVSLDKLLLGVSQWKRHQKDIATFLERQKQYLKSSNLSNKQSPNKSKQSPNKSRIKSKITGGILDLDSNTELRSQIKIHQSGISNGGNSRVSNKSNVSNSQHYLTQNFQKQSSALQQLNSTLIRTKNQSHYELTIKIGQINDICKKLKNDLTYVIVTKQDYEIQILQKSSKSGAQKHISQKYFQKRYEQLKTLNNNMMEQIEGTLQKDLRQTLVEVMFLSDQLQKQIQLLKRKGINSL